MDISVPVAAKQRRIEAASRRLGFTASCDPRVAALCGTLAASVGSGHLLELGTGTGLSTLMIAEGMTGGAWLDTVDVDRKTSDTAQRIIGFEKPITFIVEDAGDYLKKCLARQYALIFADAWPGKFSHLGLALDALARGGIYIIDDLLPQDNWPVGHQKSVNMLLALLAELDGFTVTRLDWASGVAVIVKTGTNAVPRRYYNHAEFGFLFSEA